MLVPVVSALALWSAPAATAETWWSKNGAALKTTEASTWKGNVTLHFNGSGGEYFYVTCEDTITGTVGPKGAGEMTKWTPSKCVLKSFVGEECRKTVTLEAQHLPWATTLGWVASTFRNVLPLAAQFSIKCGESTYEVCSRLPNEILKNKETGVGAEFNFSEPISCTLSSTSHLESHQEITLVSGGVLSVHHE